MLANNDSNITRSKRSYDDMMGQNYEINNDFEIGDFKNIVGNVSSGMENAMNVKMPFENAKENRKLVNTQQNMQPHYVYQAEPLDLRIRENVDADEINSILVAKENVAGKLQTFI